MKIAEGADFCLRFAARVLQVRMGYLGLDETPVKDDNMFQRMFWPSDHAGETDTLGKQGFWVCAAVGTFSLVVLSMQGHLFSGMLTFLFYLVGGCGVREHSTLAAIIVTAWYVLGQVDNLFQGAPPGALPIIASLLLAANIRGTWIAAKWIKRGSLEELPERHSETLTDKIVDQMPISVWRFGRFPFYGIGGVLVALTIVGTIMAIHNPGSAPAIEDGKTLQLAPTR